MNWFFRAKIFRFFVANLENSGLFSSICVLNRKILSPEKFTPDLIRGSLKAISWACPLVILIFSLSFAEEADLAKRRVPLDRLEKIKKIKNPFDASPENIEKGKVLYQGRGTCFTCHGKAGRGDGLAAPGFDPSPRNFTNTAFHAMRSDGELFWVIREGIPGTAMMPMVGSVITEEEAWLVLLYERSLGKR